MAEVHKAISCLLDAESPHPLRYFALKVSFNYSIYYGASWFFRIWRALYTPHRQTHPNLTSCITRHINLMCDALHCSIFLHVEPDILIKVSWCNNCNLLRFLVGLVEIAADSTYKSTIFEVFIVCFSQLFIAVSADKCQGIMI